MAVFSYVLLVALLYLGASTAYLLFFSVAGLFPTGRLAGADNPSQRVAVFIPGYKEDAVIVDTAKQALEQDYPQDLYDVVIIADSFQPATMEALRLLPIKVIEVSFDKSTKAKALNKALSQLDEADYDTCVVLDADNVMAPDFLSKITASLDDGFVAVQGHRVAKNVNTPLAVLDAISEEINNWIFRKGHVAAGFSAALIGSGMAFDFSLFKGFMQNAKAVGGFDKELELMLLAQRVQIGYAEDATVFDEKIQNEAAFVPQRTRWLSAQFHYAREYMWPAFKSCIKTRNVDFFDKAVQMVLPPRILMIGLLPIFTAFALITGWWAIEWSVVTTLFGIALLIAIPPKYLKAAFFEALPHLPKSTWLMLRALGRSPGANKTFIHTPHGQVETPSNS